MHRARRTATFGVLTATALALSPAIGLTKDGPESPCHQYYPNIPGKTLLENDKVVVQRFIFPPGQWEGVHSHPGDQLFIHIKGGQWTVRTGDTYDTGFWKTGSVGWYGAVDEKADHESKNSGSAPIELIWVTLKTGCQDRK